MTDDAAPPLQGEAPGTGPDPLPALQRRVARLRRLLASSHAAQVQVRRELARANHVQGRDLLTGLPNRGGVEPLMQRQLADHAARPRTLALLFVDLDGFKAVNDRLGHAAGDQLLRIVAARLAASMRSGDLVSRHGGDEFVCLLPDLDSEDRARALAAGLLRSITQPCALGGHMVSVSASVGVAIYPHDGSNLAELLRSADAAMYAAKQRRCGVVTAGEQVRSG